MSSHFGWLDGLFMVGYLATLAGIGAYFSRRQKNLEDYFLAGRGMGWIPVGMSLMAALNSGIDYLMGPFGTFKYGLIFLVGVTSWLFLYPWVAAVTLPFYRRLNVYSAYEYLEQRFNSHVRTLAALIFLCWRLGWMATALYVSSLAISSTTGLPLITVIVVLGSFVTLYTMLGGITAIIWTDVLQFCIMLAGVAATLVVTTLSVPGGVSGIWQFAAEKGSTALIAPIPAEADTFLEKMLFLFTDYRSIVGILLATMVGRMTMYCCEQSMIQRFKAARSTQDAKRAFVVNALGDAFWTIGLAFVGLALFAYFKGKLPAGVKEDALTVYFMREVFPTGLNGLVVAAVLASGLSAIDAAINAGTSVIMVDFYNRLVLKRVASEELSKAESQAEVRLSRIVTVLYAIAGMILAANVSRIGNLLEIANKAIQTFTGPLFGLFLLGMFTTKARGEGVFIGGLIGAATSVAVAFFTKIGFIWPTVFGLVTTVGVGYLASLMISGDTTEKARQLTWRNVMRQPAPKESVSA
jgi:SSS family transporter